MGSQRYCPFSHGLATGDMENAYRKLLPAPHVYRKYNYRTTKCIVMKTHSKVCLHERSKFYSLNLKCYLYIATLDLPEGEDRC